MAKLSQRKEKFLLAYLNTNTIEEACKEAGISESSAYNYLNDPLFKAEYRNKRREIMQHVTSRLQHSATLAVDTLNEVMEDLAERIEQLEELLNERT